MRSAYYVETLPEGYKEVQLYDIHSRRFKVLTGPVSFLVSLLLAALLLGVRVGFDFGSIPVAWRWRYLWHIGTLMGIVLVYTVLHELTHGLVYGLFTRRRLKFGFTGSLVYCGVPGIYVTRNVAAASVIAPFVLFTAVYLWLLLKLPVNVFWFVLAVSFMNHLGGCFADLYAFFVMMRADSTLLMADSGEEQRLYIRQE